MNWISCSFAVHEGKHRSLIKGFLVILLLLIVSCFVSPAYGYDPLDPNGNITIRWDLVQDNDDGTQNVGLSIVNYQLFRHIESPGWKLQWTWPGDEVIWAISGAEATEQGNCSAFKGRTFPHSCEKSPVIIDLLPDAPYNRQERNCCKGGVLSSMNQNPGNNVAGLKMLIGAAPKSLAPQIPGNFSLGVAGYTCGEPFSVPPTKYSEDQGRRKTQAVATWNVTCSYSQFRASAVPTCCVSLSAFYNQTIVACPKCSCGCRAEGGSKCVKDRDLPPMIELDRDEPPKPVLRCSYHMCPIKVHWHVKQSYKEYWRVKMTVNNLNYAKNYSEWNVVVVHPNLDNVTQVFSFNYKPLNAYGYINDTGMFYGIHHYNDMLLRSGKYGNVQTEMILHKDVGVFSFRDGWAFPRKISFNGEACVMPSPDLYPRLPMEGRSGAGASRSSPSRMMFLVTALPLFVAAMLIS